MRNMFHRGSRFAALAKVALASGVATMLPLGSSAMAQDSGSTSSSGEASATPNETVRSTVDGEETIIVTARNYVPTGSMTATKSDAPLIETPQSISVITRDQIDLLNFIDVQQAVRYTSGVVGENYGPDLRFDFLTVRGFTPIQYIDGLQAPISSTIPSVGVDLYGFESIDVLKGPASVLYGTTPPGGIYNVTSRRASSSFGGEVVAQYGTDDYKQIKGTITGPLGTGVSARITGLYLDRDSQVDYVDARRAFVAPTFTVRLGDSTRITGLAYYQYDKVNGDTNGFLPAIGTLYDNPLGEIPRGRNLGEPDYNFYRRKQFGVGWDLSHEFTDAISFDQNVKWFQYKELQNVIYGGSLGADNRTVTRYNFPYKEDVFEFAADNRLRADFSLGAVENQLLVGFDYRNFRNESQFGFAFASSIDLFEPEYGAAPITTPGFFPFSNQRVRQKGVYVQDQAKIGGLVLTLSGRQDWLDTDDRNADDSYKDDKFTYRLGANYVFDNGFAPYISYATSFVPVVGTDRNGDRFVPSSGKQIEAGIKFDGRMLNDDIRIFTTAAVFKIVQSNVLTQAADNPVFQEQTGEVTVKGLELEGVARIREQLSINGSYTYLDAKVTESNGGGLAEEGNRLSTTPKHKFSLFADYVIQQGALGGLGFGAGVRHLSSNYGDAANVYKMHATTLFDAILHYDLPDWRLSVNGSNIFDKKYVGRCSGPVGCIYGQSRQVIVSLARKF